MEKISNFLKNLFRATVFAGLMYQCSGILLPPVPNFISNPEVRSEVNDNSMLTLVFELESRAALGYKSIDIDINSFGGSVMAGHNAIEVIKRLDSNGIVINCHVRNKAMSMGFTILQFCTIRTIYPDSIIMQHMIHDGNGRENMVFNTKEEETSIYFLDRLHGESEAERLGITYDEYEARYQFGKWYKGFEACKDGVADIYVDYDGTEYICEDIEGPVRKVKEDGPAIQNEVSKKLVVGDFFGVLIR